jgi:hypothetical protein
MLRKWIMELHIKLMRFYCTKKQTSTKLEGHVYNKEIESAKCMLKSES